MRHRVHNRKLGRTSAHRKALFRNQLASLFTHERVVTTLPKAKELRPLAERMVTLARTGTVPARRQVLSVVPDKQVVKRLFDEIAPRFTERPGGYTRIVKLGPRHGDGAELAVIEFVDFKLEAKREGKGEEKKSLMDRAKSMLGGGAKASKGETATAPEAANETAEVEADAEKDQPSAE